MSTLEKGKKSQAERPYHHGSLRSALVEAALATARQNGPDAVVLRAATRDAGVSPNAAYRHFSDREALLEEVALQCLTRMAALVRRRITEGEPYRGAEGAWRRLRVAGRGYVEFALAEPGWFQTAFSCPFDPAAGGSPSNLGPGDAEPESETDDLYAILVRVLDQMVEAGALKPKARPHAEFVAWSAVHGVATLLTTGPLRALSPADREAAIDRVVNAVSF